MKGLTNKKEILTGEIMYKIAILNGKVISKIKAKDLTMDGKANTLELREFYNRISKFLKDNNIEIKTFRCELEKE